MEKEIVIDQKKTALIVIGMAGSGKTTFIQRFIQYIMADKVDPGVIMNLDPAVQFTPYTADIDIRKKIDYKKLMHTHSLGPNGAIMTALNLYCTQIDEVLHEYDVCKGNSEYLVVDTPGQIEVFTWSASGTIFAQSISSSMPTVLVYVLDIARCQDPNSFVSNMLFCCSIFYRLKLPMIVVFNKEDTSDKEILIEWMSDYDNLLDALRNESTYLSTLSKSMVLSLDEFYSDLKYVCVSSKTGSGFEKLYPLIEQARQEYFEITYPDLQKNFDENMKKELARQQQEMDRFNKDKTELEKGNKAENLGYKPSMNVQIIGDQNQFKTEKKSIKLKKVEEKVEKNSKNDVIICTEDIKNLELNK